MSGRDTGLGARIEKPLSARKAGEALGVSSDTVRALAEAGELRGCWRVGRRGDLRVPPSAVADYKRRYGVGA